MCLGIPGQVIEMLEGYGGQLALVDVSGAPRKINIGMLELDQQDLAPGDWVLIHMGFAVERTWGGWDGAPIHLARNRMLILARRAA